MLFWYEAPGMEEGICRYPAVLDTDEFSQETEDESWQTNESMEASLEESDWFGTMSPINNERFWEPPSESWITETDREMLTDGSDDSDWRRPPPINTAGLEWFYD